MTTQTILDLFKENLFAILDETFEKVHGIYLDRGTSLFETLDTITAEQASRPVSERCANMAAQVRHVRFYMEVLPRYIRGEEVGKIDWAASWDMTPVDDAGWQALKDELRATYADVRTLLLSLETWDGEEEIGGALAIVVHTAYHLGEIRQALCTLQ